MSDLSTPSGGGERISEEEMQAIRQREQAATDGPWAWANTCEKGYGANVGAGVFADDDELCDSPLSGDLTGQDGYDVGQGIAELSHQGCSADAHFIAHARTDIPKLLDEVAALHRENSTLRAERETLAKLHTGPGLLSDEEYEAASALAFRTIPDTTESAP